MSPIESLDWFELKTQTIWLEADLSGNWFTVFSCRHQSTLKGRGEGVESVKHCYVADKRRSGDLII